MVTRLFIFEDDKFDQFFPLTYTRPVYDLLFGMTSTGSMIGSLFPSVQETLLCRDYMTGVLKERMGQAVYVNHLEAAADDEVLVVNGRLLPSSGLRQELGASGEDQLLVAKGDIVGWHGGGRAFERLRGRFERLHDKNAITDLKSELKCVEVEAQMVRYLWDLVIRNAEVIQADFERFKRTLDSNGMFKHCEVDDQALLYEVDRVYIGKGSKIDGHVVLDARSGPIFIGSNVHIQPFTRVEGPCFVGEGSILVGGKIRGGTSIGPHCRMGGEVEQSIFQGYSNKYHEGFLGHSFVGEWVNLGALTTNSDLKNNYGPVKVVVNGDLVDSGETKVGAFIGDHAKTGIGTLLNTGVTIGFASNVFGGGMIKQKSIPSFFWGGAQGGETYRLEEAIKTAEVVMQRRGKELTAANVDLFKKVFQLTDKERRE